MKNLRDFLLSRKGWRDEKGNTLAFFERGLEGEPEKDALWFFLDEGLRCGGAAKANPAGGSGAGKAAAGVRQAGALGTAGKGYRKVEKRRVRTCLWKS